MTATMKNRVPVSLRLPRELVDAIDSYTVKNDLKKTDAYIHFLQRGISLDQQDAFVKKIDRNTVFLMDVLYQRICKWGKIGSKSATCLFSRTLRSLTERAISQIRRDADDAIVQRWDFAEGEWQSTIYESDLDRAERELMEVRKIVAHYQKREAFKVGLTDEDETRIKRTLDNAKVQDPGSLINLAGPVKRLRGVSNRKR